MAIYYISHSGVPGMRAGDRNGPPYPLSAAVRSVLAARAKAKEKKLIKKRFKTATKLSKLEDSRKNAINERSNVQTSIDMLDAEINRQKKGIKDLSSKIDEDRNNLFDKIQGKRRDKLIEDLQRSLDEKMSNIEDRDELDYEIQKLTDKITASSKRIDRIDTKLVKLGQNMFEKHISSRDKETDREYERGIESGLTRKGEDANSFKIRSDEARDKAWKVIMRASNKLGNKMYDDKKKIRYSDLDITDSILIPKLWKVQDEILRTGEIPSVSEIERYIQDELKGQLT